jgi:hypothetical protein
LLRKKRRKPLLDSRAVEFSCNARGRLSQHSYQLIILRAQEMATMRYRSCSRGAQNEGRRQEACLVMLPQARSLGRIKLELLIQATRLLSDVVVIGPTVESGRDGAPAAPTPQKRRKKCFACRSLTKHFLYSRPLRARGESSKLHTETYYQAFDSPSVFSSMRLHIEFNQSICD